MTVLADDRAVPKAIEELLSWRQVSAFEHRLASESLSRVDCPFCHQRLYTHAPDCPAGIARERDAERLAAIMLAAFRDVTEDDGS